ARVVHVDVDGGRRRRAAWRIVHVGHVLRRRHRQSHERQEGAKQECGPHARSSLGPHASPFRPRPRCRLAWQPAGYLRPGGFGATMSAVGLKPYLTVDDLSVKGKTVLLRVDINAPIVDGKVAGKDRIEAAAATVDQIAAKGARVVVLAHQGRKGDADFTSLAEHARILDAITKCDVSFVEDIAGPLALASIRALPAGS